MRWVQTPLNGNVVIPGAAALRLPCGQTQSGRNKLTASLQQGNTAFCSQTMTEQKWGEKKKLFNYWSAGSNPSLFHRTCWRTVPEDAAAESSQQTGSQRRVVHDNNDETLFLVKSIFRSMSHLSLAWIRHGENGEKRSLFCGAISLPENKDFYQNISPLHHLGEFDETDLCRECK